VLVGEESVTARLEEILKHVNLASAPSANIDDWTAAVAHRFGPYVRRKRILTRDRQSLRTELINLAQIEAFRGGPDALSFSKFIERLSVLTKLPQLNFWLKDLRIYFALTGTGWRYSWRKTEGSMSRACTITRSAASQR